MRILETGSDGFIGNTLVEYLTKTCGHFVAKFDIASGMDILNNEHLEYVFANFKPEAVYHLASQPDPKKGEDDPELDMDINIKATHRLIQKMIEFDCHVLVFTSSDAAENPTTNYGVSKRAAELYIQKYCKSGQIQGKIARFSSIYGPNRTRNGKQAGPVNIFLDNGIHNRPLEVYGVNTLRDYMYVWDACRALELIQRDGVIGEIYNVGSGVRHTSLEVAEVAKMITGAEIILNDSPSLTESSSFNVTKLAKLGFVPEYDLLSGMKFTHQMMQVKKPDITDK